MMDWLDQRSVETLAWTLLHSVWQITLVAALAWAILTALPRTAARARHTLACAALIIMAAALPATFYAIAPSSPAVEHSAPALTPVPIAAAPDLEQLLILDHPSHFMSVPVTKKSPNLGWPALGWLVLAYAAGLAIASLRLAIGWSMTRRLRRGTLTPALRQRADHLARRMGLRSIRIVQNPAAHVPLVIGILRPVVVLPLLAATGLTPDQLDALLAHEFAHLRRLDPLANFLQTLLETILFYHPAVWWISRVIRTERECCCDEIAVAVTNDRPGYARALAAMETLRVPAPALGATGGDLSARIRRLLQRDPRTPSYAPVAALLGLIVIASIIWGCTASASRGPSATPATQPTFVPEQVHPFADLYMPADGNPPRNFAEARLHAENEMRLQLQEGMQVLETPDEAREAAANERTAAKLKEQISAVTADAATLEHNVTLIGNSAGIAILANWRALEAAGITRDAPVTISLHKVPAEKAIRQMLDQVSGDKANLDYVIEDGVVEISTKDDLLSEQYRAIRVYDIRDLLVWAASEPLSLPTDDKPKPPTADEQKGWAAAVTKQIVDALETTIAPGTWRDKGGKIGSIRELNGQLIVSQVPENLQPVGEAINQMRAAHALQVSLESRVYVLSRDRMAALVAKYPGAGEEGHGQVIGNDQLPALLKNLEADKSTWFQIAPRITVFNNGVARVHFTDSTGGNNAFSDAIQATVSKDRKSAILQGLLGLPKSLEIRPAPAAFATVPNGSIVLLNGGRISDKGSLGHVLWVVRPQIITQAQIEQGKF